MHEAITPYSLAVYAQDLMSDVLALTNYAFAIEEVPQLEFDSELAVASGSRPIHMLRFMSGYRPYLVHRWASLVYREITRFYADWLNALPGRGKQETDLVHSIAEDIGWVPSTSDPWPEPSYAVLFARAEALLRCERANPEERPDLERLVGFLRNRAEGLLANPV